MCVYHYTKDGGGAALVPWQNCRHTIEMLTICARASARRRDEVLMCRMLCVLWERLNFRYAQREREYPQIYVEHIYMYIHIYFCDCFPGPGRAPCAACELERYPPKKITVKCECVCVCVCASVCVWFVERFKARETDIDQKQIARRDAVGRSWVVVNM